MLKDLKVFSHPSTLPISVKDDAVCIEVAIRADESTDRGVRLKRKYKQKMKDATLIIIQYTAFYSSSYG